MLGDIQVQLLDVLGLKLERVVDLGPFKHKVDDGLVIRKAALTCIEEILNSHPDQSNLALFLESFVTQKLSMLLNDKDEVKLSTHQVKDNCAYIMSTYIYNTSYMSTYI